MLLHVIQPLHIAGHESSFCVSTRASQHHPCRWVSCSEQQFLFPRHSFAVALLLHHRSFCKSVNVYSSPEQIHLLQLLQVLKPICGSHTQDYFCPLLITDSAVSFKKIFPKPGWEYVQCSPKAKGFGRTNDAQWREQRWGSLRRGTLHPHILAAKRPKS